MLLIYCICWMAEDRFQCAQCREIVKSKTISNKPLYLQLYMYPKKKHSCPPSGYHSSSKNRFFRHPNGFIIQIIQRSKLQTLVLDGFFNNPKSPRQPKFESWQWLCSRCDGRTGQGRFCVFSWKILPNIICFNSNF